MLHANSWLKTLLPGFALLASAASAQSLYVDLGTPPTPSSAYGAAAGVPGYWNAVNGIQGSIPPLAPLLDIHGQPTGASARAFHCDSDSSDFPGTTGDDEALLDDFWYTDCNWKFPDHPTIQVVGLEAGTYQLFVYHTAAGSAATQIDVTLNHGTVEGGSPMNIPQTGPFPGSYANWGIGVAVLHVTLDGANVDMVTGWSTGGLAGFQLLRLDDATPFCSGDLGACPCGVGAPLSGCPSSFNSAGALMSGHGSRQVSSDTMRLTAVGVLDSGLCIFFQGSSAQGLGLGSPFGDGLRCAGGTFTRIASKTAVNGVARYPSSTEVPLSVKGGVPASGGFRTYQVRYRNAAPYCTTETFNTTNGVAIEWLP